MKKPSRIRRIELVPATTPVPISLTGQIRSYEPFVGNNATFFAIDEENGLDQLSPEDGERLAKLILANSDTRIHFYEKP